MSAVPGWYPDPASADSLRYWSGSAWTEQTQPAALAAPPVSAPVMVQAHPQPLPQQLTPATSMATTAVGYRSDVWLPAGMVERGGLPFMCVKHGRLAAQMPRTSVYSRAPIWTYPLLILSLLIGAIVMLALRVTVTGPWPMCHECVATRRHRKQMMWASLGVFVLGIVVSIWFKTPWGVLVGLVALVAAVVFGALSSWTQLTQAYVDRRTHSVRIRRPAGAFVQHLPQ